MIPKSLKNIFLLVICSVLFVSVTAQNKPNKKSDISDRYNYFLQPDSIHQIEVNPFLWKDYPCNLSNPKDLKDTYKESLKVGNGYKLLQLSKLEFDNVYTYCNLVPSRMLHESYLIALKNADPYLALYIVGYDCRYNLGSVFTYDEMMSQVDSLATLYKNVDVLYKLAAIADTFDELMKHSTPARVRAKALFINNKDFAPYPNLYDCPEVDKPLDTTPFLWSNFPTTINTEAKFTADYKAALKKNDGYRLLQLAKVAFDKKTSKTVTPNGIVQQAYNIACYNKDPYLLLYVCLFNKETQLLDNLKAVDVFRQAYNITIERRDAKSLYVLYDYEKKYDFMPDVTPKKMFQKGIQIERLYKEPIIYNFQKWIAPPTVKKRGTPKPIQNQSDEDW